MGKERAPVGAFARSSPAARVYRSLWADVSGALWPEG